MLKKIDFSENRSISRAEVHCILDMIKGMRKLLEAAPEGMFALRDIRATLDRLTDYFFALDQGLPWNDNHLVMAHLPSDTPSLTKTDDQ